jgi:phenylalanyl-tRNA synthetase beta chain
MLLSYNWIQNYIKIPCTADDIFKKLSLAGLEISKTQLIGDKIHDVVISEILTINKHPNADRLSIAHVTDGEKTYQIVCGAKNILPHQKVPLAKIGAKLPNNQIIQSTKIRNIESFGMLCSAQELGFSNNSDGIFILPPDAIIGQSILTYLNLPDILFEIEITPNRPDLLSHFGIAREISSLLKISIQLPSIYKPPLEANFPEYSRLNSTSPSSYTIKVQDSSICPLYASCLIPNVKVSPSPFWLSQWLERIGHRSVNNIVDITNLILFEFGQPLHAFDFKTISSDKKNKTLNIRSAQNMESILLLNNQSVSLNSSMLVIADDQHPIALAGIMGGFNSQVTDKTQDVLLESAWFQPSVIRKAARKLEISTDASYRFERGVDPRMVIPALKYARDLILKTSNSSSYQTAIHRSRHSSSKSPVILNTFKTVSLLGIEISPNKQTEILSWIGCKIMNNDVLPGSIKVRPPSYRIDLGHEIDLIEEIARINGYNNIPIAFPKIPVTYMRSDYPHQVVLKLRTLFEHFGLSEAINSPFLESAYFENSIKLLNPIADDQKYLRTSLIPSLIKNVALNISHQNPDIGLYEINRIFSFEQNAPIETKYATAVLHGSHFNKSWNSFEKKWDFFDLKELANHILTQIPMQAHWNFNCSPEHSFFENHQNFEIIVQNQKLIHGGLISSNFLKPYNIVEPCLGIEINLSCFEEWIKQDVFFNPFPKFPSAWRDLCFIVPSTIYNQVIELEMLNTVGPDLKSIHLFDVYKDPSLPQNSNSLTYRLIFQNNEKTLTDLEINQYISDIIAQLKEKYSIALR